MGVDTVRFVRNLAKSENGHGQMGQNEQMRQNGHVQNKQIGAWKTEKVNKADETEKTDKADNGSTI